MIRNWIIDAWYAGHSKSWLVAEEMKRLKLENEKLKPAELSRVARTNVEAALLEHWKKEVASE